MSTRGGRAAGSRAIPRGRSVSRHWVRFAVAPVLCSIRTHRGRYNRAALSNTRGSQTRVVLTLTGLPTHDRHSQTGNESRSQSTASAATSHDWGSYAIDELCVPNFHNH
jgi:hypothetical protein